MVQPTGVCRSLLTILTAGLGLAPALDYPVRPVSICVPFESICHVFRYRACEPVDQFIHPATMFR